MEKFADNKIVIRQQNLRAMKKLLEKLTSERGLRLLLPYIHHSNSHIREQAINVLIQALLAAPSQPSELYCSLLSTLVLALDDAKPKVKLVALEAIAVLHDAMGGGTFDAQRREVGLSAALGQQVDERLQQGRGTLPTMSNDGLVEFTTQSALPPSGGLRGTSAAGRVLVPASVGSNGLVVAAVGASGCEGGGSGGGGGGDDLLELMEVTAGGRRIATSRGKLPWEPAAAPPRSASGGSRHLNVSSRHGAREYSISSLPLDTAHEEVEAEAVAAKQGKLVDLQKRRRAERGASAVGMRFDGAMGVGMRIQVPATGAGTGPLSAPIEAPPWRLALSRQNGVWEGWPSLGGSTRVLAGGLGGSGSSVSASAYLELEPLGLGHSTPSFSGSLQHELELGEHEKIQLWLPVGQAQQGFARPQQSRRSVDDVMAIGFEGGSGTAPPQEGLRFVKRRGAPAVPIDPLGGASQQARVSAAGKAPHVRLPFEEKPRSSSAPHRRTVGRDTLQRAVKDTQRCVCYTAAEAAACGGGGGRRFGGISGGSLEEPVLAATGMFGSAHRSGLRHDRILIEPPAAVEVDNTRQIATGTCAGGLQGFGYVLAEGCVPAATSIKAPSPLPRKNTGDLSVSATVIEMGGDNVRAPTNAAKIEELRTEDLKQQPPPQQPEAAVRVALEQLRGDDWTEQFEAINTLRRLLAWQGPQSEPALLDNLHTVVLLMIQVREDTRQLNPLC